MKQFRQVSAVVGLFTNKSSCRLSQLSCTVELSLQMESGSEEQVEPYHVGCKRKESTCENCSYQAMK